MDQVSGVDLTRCPQCGLVAEIVARDVWDSTDGPIEHAHVWCVARHRFVMPVASLAAAVGEPVVAVSRPSRVPPARRP